MVGNREVKGVPVGKKVKFSFLGADRKICES